MPLDPVVPPSLQWRVHLYAQQRGKAWPLLGITMLGGLLAGLAFRQVGYGLLALLLIFMSTREYWLPVRYWLDEEGAHMATLLARYDIAWSRVKYISATDDGRLKLSSVPMASRLAPFRGVELRLPPDQQPVMQAIKHWRALCG